MEYETIIFEVHDAVAVIKVNRPKALNAINPQVLKDINGALDEIDANPELRVLILTGEGEKAFVAGADIGYMVELTPLEARAFSLYGKELFVRLESLPIPVIACVNGFALGGGMEIAMGCDFIYASENAKFGQPEINLGIIPGLGGTQYLPRLVGKAMAKELCMTGVMMSAAEAKAIGLVNRVFPPEQLWEKTMKTAQSICSKGREAMRSVKRTIDRGSELDLHTACYLEADEFALCMANPDRKEGMSAFLEKRKPDFKGELI